MTPEQIREREKHNTLANRLYQKHSITEALIRSSFEEGFNKNLDIIWRTGDISFLEEENETHTNTPHNPEWIEQPREISKAQEITLERTPETIPEKNLSRLEKQTKNPVKSRFFRTHKL